MDYVGVAEEEGGEPVEIPVEEDGTGGHENRTHRVGIGGHECRTRGERLSADNSCVLYKNGQFFSSCHGRMTCL
jgi:hypothetical protein